MDTDDIEELSFGDSARGAGYFEDDGNDPGGGRRGGGRPWATALAVILTLALVAGGCGFGWLYWRDHLREIPVVFNGRTVDVRVDRSLADIIQANNGFGAHPGRLISVAGEPIAGEHGGAIHATLNGRTVSQAELERTYPAEGQRLTLRDGDDRTEGHKAHVETIPHGTGDMDANSGGIIQIRFPGRDGQRVVWTGKTSGVTVDKGVTVEPQQERITSYTPHPPAGRKVIALTFDDGPSQYTAPMLDILKAKGAKATFFNVGTAAAAMPAVVRRMAAEGHQVASHSNTHPDMPGMGTDALRGEIAAGFDNLAKAGSDSRMFRAPYGAFTTKDWQRAGDLISTNVLWSIDTLDWKRPGADAIRDTVLANAYNGAVVLMHTGGGDRSQDVEALPAIIDGLRAQGYEFVTVGELMAMDAGHRFPDWAVKGELPPKDGGAAK